MLVAFATTAIWRMSVNGRKAAGIPIEEGNRRPPQVCRAGRCFAEQMGLELRRYEKPIVLTLSIQRAVANLPPKAYTR